MSTIKSLDYTSVWKSKTFSDSSFLIELRTKALTALESLPFPSQAQESWRKVSLSNLKPLSYLENSSSKIHLTHNSGNIQIKSFNELNEKESSEFEFILKNAQDNLKENYFSQMSLAFFSEIYFISLSEQNTTDQILSIQLKTNNPSSLPVFVFDIGKFNKAKVQLHYKVEETQDLSFFNSLEIVNLRESSQIEFINVEDFGKSVFHFRNLMLTQLRDSSSLVSHFNLGGYRGKTFLHSNLKGKGARAEIIGATAVSGREQQDIEINVIHSEGHTESNLLFRTVATDKAHHVFTGILNIPKTSLHVQANQTNNNLMLKRTARTESMPKLEVFADDVKCSHGATMGEVNEEQMFYLLSRGLPEELARHLIVEGFLSEILDRVSDENLREELRERLLKKLSV